MLHKIRPTRHPCSVEGRHGSTGMATVTGRVVKFADRSQLVDRSETNLSSVPANHPLLSLPSLDAEAQGLLDRLLSILQEERR